MAAYPAVWEHLVVYLEAVAQQQAAFLQQKWPGQHFPMYAAQALMSQLDFYGQQGWELVSIQPVIVGANGDIMIHNPHAGYADRWTFAYLCVVKRPR